MTLKQLWHEVIYQKQGKRCKYCGEYSEQVHHIIPKSQSELLRYDWKNGVVLCQLHHQSAQDNDFIDKWLQSTWKHMKYLKKMNQMSYKQYLLEQGLTEKGWLKLKRIELQEIINVGI
jgi:hypothetical protein